MKIGTTTAPSIRQANIGFLDIRDAYYPLCLLKPQGLSGGVGSQKGIEFISRRKIARRIRSDH